MHSLPSFWEWLKHAEPIFAITHFVMTSRGVHAEYRHPNLWEKGIAHDVYSCTRTYQKWTEDFQNKNGRKIISNFQSEMNSCHLTPRRYFRLGV